MVLAESDLYQPVKRFLESQGYEVKGEVGACDVVARRGQATPIVVELKLSLNLELVLQAVERLSVTPNVYLGVPAGNSTLKKRRRHTLKLLRMLGLGLLVVDLGVKDKSVTAVLDPGPYRPSPSRAKGQRLLREFVDRVGDPNSGGMSSRKGVMTAYRQRALRIGQFLQSNGATRASSVAAAVGDPNARGVLYDDVYGWFERQSRGVYALSPRGAKELPTWLTNRY